MRQIVIGQTLMVICCNDSTCYRGCIHGRACVDACVMN